MQQPRHEPDAAPGTTRETAASGRLRRLGGDLSGAFADLGTFLPLVIGVLALQDLDPSGVLVGFGLFALVTALVYRRPVPVQPMKAVAALVVAGGLGAQAVAATGLVLGAVLCLLAATGVVGWLARALPQSVLAGVQLGVGLYLAWAGLLLAVEAPIIGGLALAVLVALLKTRLKPVAALAVVAAAAAWGATRPGAMLPDLAPALHLPTAGLPDAAAVLTALETAVLPQLALTVTNAVLITAAIAANYFPADRERITPARLAWSSGSLNLLLAPLGAFPMCHGAGGLVVQHRFGARSGLAPALFGTTCLALGLFLGPQALALLALVPLAAVGALLVLAGGELAISKRLFDSRPDCLVVILATGLMCVTVNVAVGLVAGLALEGLRSTLLRRRAAH